MRVAFTAVFSVLAVLALTPSAAAGKKLEAKAAMVRPDDAPDDDASGEIKLRLDPDKGDQRFEVKVKDVAANVAYGLWIQDAPDAETFTHIADLEHDHEDHDDDKGADVKLKLDTKKGDGLPLGVEQLSELEGLRLELRHDGELYLHGDVPALDGGDGPGDGASDKKDEAISLLVRPDDAPEPQASGRIRLRTDPKKGRDEFEVEADHVQALDPQHEVFLQDAPDAETFSSLGVMDVDGDDLELEFDTSDGDALPLGAESLDELAGLRLEIRRGDDVILFGLVPAFGAAQKPVKIKAEYGPGPDADAKTKARLDMRSKPSKGDEHIELKVKALSFADDAEYRLFVETGVEDGEGGEIVLYDDVGEVEQYGSSHNARYRRKTKKGQGLPLGVSSVIDLLGLRFEVRDDHGDVHVAGAIPDGDN